MKINKCAIMNALPSSLIRRGFLSSAVAATVVTRTERRYFSADASQPGTAYVPPSKVEDLYSATKGNKFAGLNSPVAGARHEAQLPRGDQSFQLYSLSTPNGQKVGIMLEELGIKYDAHGLFSCLQYCCDV